MFSDMLSLLRMYGGRRKQSVAPAGTRKDQELVALTKLGDALRETQSYLNGLAPATSGAKSKREICRLWGEAARSLAHHDTELASQCLTKSSYWSDPQAGSARDQESALLQQCLEELGNLRRARFGTGPGKQGI